MYIDAHCHLNDTAFTQVEATMSEVKAAGVGIVICSGYDMESSYRAKELAEKYEEIYFCAGFQPQEVGKYQEGDIERLRDLVRHEKCIAVGEIGLDYHYPDNPAKEFQREIFEKQIELAHEEGLPIVIHSRDCAEDMQTVLQENIAKLGHGGLLHCYSHSAEQSVAFEKLGMYFSFGGTATFENSRKVVKSVARVSLDRILTETDSPYLTPVPKRGTFPNTPANIPYIAAKLAQLRGITEEELTTAVYQNAKRLFKKIK
ncbi:MAG: TatD family hydrolase [Clostridia bacterium]|nr:TatD family hydrolase [Clostridia bacterium]